MRGAVAVINLENMLHQTQINMLETHALCIHFHEKIDNYRKKYFF